MKDIEINRMGIVILQWFSGTDNWGGELYDSLKNKNNHDNYFVELYCAKNKQELINNLNHLIDTTKEGTIFTLHIVSHGNENGIGTSISDFMTWKELFSFTRQLNIIMHNTLLIVLSSCVGGGILSSIEPELRAPYMAFIGNTREVMIKDAQKGFPLFYQDYFSPMDFANGLKRLNESIDFSEELSPGRKKTEFFIMTAASSFDEVFNPDRDPMHFASIVDKLPPFKGVITKEQQIEKAKDYMRKRGEELRPYFTFQEEIKK